MKKAIILLLALMPFSSCEYLNQSIDRYYIGGDAYFQHGVDNVIVNRTLGVCHINFFDGRQKSFALEKISIDSTAGELKINNVILYF